MSSAKSDIHATSIWILDTHEFVAIDECDSIVSVGSAWYVLDRGAGPSVDVRRFLEDTDMGATRDVYLGIELNNIHPNIHPSTEITANHGKIKYHPSSHPANSCHSLRPTPSTSWPRSNHTHTHHHLLRPTAHDCFTACVALTVLCHQRTMPIERIP